MKFRNVSIKWQFIIVITLVALPFLLLSFYNLHEEKKNEIEQAQKLAISIARNIGLQQKSSEASTRQMLSLLAKLPELQDPKFDNEQLNLLLKSVMSNNPQFAVVLAALPNGDVYAAPLPFTPFSIADRKYYKDVLRTHSFAVGEFAKSRLTNRFVIHYALPVLDDKQNLKMILIASFDLTQYQNLLSVSSLPKGSDFAFYDYSGRTLYHSRGSQKYAGKRGTTEIQNVIISQSNEGAYFGTGEDGIKRLYGYVRMNIEKESPYMYIVISTPISEAFKEANKEFYRNVFLTILAVTLSIFISIYYRSFIFKNVDRLVEIANKFKDGDLSPRTNLDYSSGETGTLALAMDKMADALLSRENEKDIVHKNLKILTERFEIAVNAARIGIWEWDLATLKLFWDPQMFSLYSIEPDTFKGTISDWMKRLHPEDSVRFEEELHHSISHKKNFKTSFRIRISKNEFRNIRCYFNVIQDKSGKAIRVTGVNWDITERTQLEKDLLQSKEEAEASVRALKANLQRVIAELHEKVVKMDDVTRADDKARMDELGKEILACGKEIEKELLEITQDL